MKKHQQHLKIDLQQNAAGARGSHSFWPAFSTSLSCLLTPLNIPKVDDLVLGMVVPSDVRKRKVPRLYARDPSFFLRLVFDIFLNPLFRRNPSRRVVVLMISNLPESFHFEQSLAFWFVLTAGERIGVSALTGGDGCLVCHFGKILLINTFECSLCQPDS